MGLSSYITTATASGSGGITHTVSNPGNNNFAWLSSTHIEIRLSAAGQSLVSFNTAITNGTINKLSAGYTLIGSTLTLSGLTSNAVYYWEVKRVTPKIAHYVDFQAGSPITESDLDNSNRYALYRTQELEDLVAPYTLTLAKMKTASGINGDFVDTLSVQTVSNKIFPASGEGSNFDCGSANWNGI